MAINYICRICGPDINCSSVLGEKPSLEIPYNSLNFKSENNKPDPVEVMIEVLAVGENDVLEIGGPFNLSKYFGTLTCLRTVSSSFHFVDFDESFFHSSSVDATIIASNICLIIGEQGGIVFVTQ